MYYTIYKITNKLDNKFYIGKHKTSNLEDGYMGSGVQLRQAYEKYGMDNFHKEIICLCESEEEMNQKERELVIVDKDISYNLTAGGGGSWDHINNDPKYLEGKKYAQKRAAEVMAEKYGPDWARMIAKKGNKTRLEKYPNLSSETAKRNHQLGHFDWTGRKHTPETLAKLKIAHKDIHAGERNSQYGTCWVHDTHHNKKIKKTQLDKYLSLGYTKGRKMELHR
jgi:GIY-YIG catalytic domain